jgi:hypothetical protein
VNKFQLRSFANRYTLTTARSFFGRGVEGKTGFDLPKCGSVLPVIFSGVGRPASLVLSRKSDRARTKSIAVGNDDGKLLAFRIILPSSVDSDLMAWVVGVSVRDA